VEPHYEQDLTVTMATSAGIDILQTDTFPLKARTTVWAPEVFPRVHTHNALLGFFFHLELDEGSYFPKMGNFC
jgi:hypothetical protein